MKTNQEVYKFPRVCSISGEGMWEGYCFGDGEEYAKEKEFAEIIAKRDGYASLDESYDDEHHYWTEWEDLDEDGWYESKHEDGRDAVWVDANTATDIVKSEINLELTEQQMYEVVKHFIENTHSADRLRDILLEAIDNTKDEQVIADIFRNWVK